MKILNLEQGTPEWLASRAGKVTASRIADIMAKGRGGAESASRRNYKAEMVAEILTGKPVEQSFENDAMRWGREQEPYARAAYEAKRGVLVEKVGLVLHPTIERGAASPDGVINWIDDTIEGLVEIKCPKTATHIDNLTAKAPPSDYQLQMLWQMACTGAQWCDFVSYDPRLPEHLQLLVMPFKRDEARIAEITKEVQAFLAEVDATVERLSSIALEMA